MTIVRGQFAPKRYPLMGTPLIIDEGQQSLPIKLFDDRKLRLRAAEVAWDTIAWPQVERTIEGMVASLRVAGGTGLAAPPSPHNSHFSSFSTFSRTIGLTLY